MQYGGPANQEGTAPRGQWLPGLQGTGGLDLWNFAKSQLGRTIADPTMGALMGGPVGAPLYWAYHGTDVGPSILREGYKPWMRAVRMPLEQAANKPAVFFSERPEEAANYGKQVLRSWIPDERVLDLRGKGWPMPGTATGQVNPLNPVVAPDIIKAMQQGGFAGIRTGPQTLMFNPGAIGKTSLYSTGNVKY